MSAGGSSSQRGGAPIYDQALKLLGDRWAPQLTRLLLPDAELEVPLSGDLPVSERRADWLWRVRLDGQPCALHIEFQLRAKANLADRLFEYASRIYTQHKLPPVSMLLYLVRTHPLAISPFEARAGSREGLRYPFEVVRLWEIDPAPIMAGELGGLLPLVPLLRGARAEQLPQLAERVVEQPGEPMRRGDQISLLATFGALRFPKVNVWDLLRRSTMLSELMEELVEDSPFLRQLRDETLERGTREGREEGREEGRQEGEVEEARATLHRLVRWRFPTLTEADLAAVDTITALDRLHALQDESLEMLDADTFLRALRDTQA